MFGELVPRSRPFIDAELSDPDTDAVNSNKKRCPEGVVMNAKPLIGIAVFLCLFIGFTASAPAADEPVDDGPILDERPADEDEAIDLFTRNFVWSADVVAMEGGRTPEMAHFYQGRHKKALSPVEFYEVVGRDDLAAQYRKTRRLSIIAGVGTSALMLGTGVGLMVAGDPVDSLGVWAVGLGLTISSGGMGFVVGSLFEPHPLEPYERHEIAEDYNLRLLDELGLDEEELPEEDGDPLWVEDFGINPFVERQPDGSTTGGGLAIGGRF